MDKESAPLDAARGPAGRSRAKRDEGTKGQQPLSECEPRRRLVKITTLFSARGTEKLRNRDPTRVTFVRFFAHASAHRNATLRTGKGTKRIARRRPAKEMRDRISSLPHAADSRKILRIIRLLNSSRKCISDRAQAFDVSDLAVRFIGATSYTAIIHAGAPRKDGR